MNLAAWILAWGLSHWRYILVAAAVAIPTASVSYKAGHKVGYHQGYATGQTDLRKAVAKDVKERNDASAAAEAVVRDCVADPDCRLRDDEYRRD